jgi:hypothetical protein
MPGEACRWVFVQEVPRDLSSQCLGWVCCSSLFLVHVNTVKADNKQRCG